MNLLHPVVFLRLVAGALSTSLFLLAALASLRVLRHFRARDASEGQLALERQAELSATLARVGAIAQVVALWMSVLTADRLTRVIRGAMCGYGVVTANAWGWPSIAATVTASLGAGVLLQLLAFDGRVRGLELMRPLAITSLVVAPLAIVDLSFATAWLTHIDFSVVASCCSAGLDAGADHAPGYLSGPRTLATIGAAALAVVAIGLAAFAAKKPGRLAVTLAGGTTVAALPAALLAIVLEVAPHVYEVPEHLCPFCLFRPEGYYIGYPLFAGLFYAVVCGLGAATSALLARSPSVRAPFAAFARSRMRRQAAAWATVLVVGALPVVLYAAASGGASLFR